MSGIHETVQAMSAEQAIDPTKAAACCGDGCCDDGCDAGCCAASCC